MMVLNNIDDFDSTNESFPLESEEDFQENSQEFDWKIINSQNLPAKEKFECYFEERETEINSFNITKAFIKTNYFNVIYPKRVSLFTLLESDNSTYDETFLRRKRSSQRKKRLENLDNIVKKIKVGFLNTALIKKLNEKMKKIGSRLNLEKFPKHFVSDINHQRNNQLLNMTIKEIFVKKELYQKDELKKYTNNFKVIENKDIKDNTELKRILNKKCFEVFEEYVHSEEFQIKEIERLKEKKMSDDYIENYINVAKHYIDYFTK